MAKAARAHGRLGQREDFESALREAMDLHERLPAQEPTRFGQDTARDRAVLPHILVSYAGSPCIWLGLAKEAQHHAESALQQYSAALAERRSPLREGIARIDLGLARTVLGSPDEACALGR